VTAGSGGIAGGPDEEGKGGSTAAMNKDGAVSRLDTNLMLMEGGPLPVYPIGRETRMPTHFYMAWHHNRWLNSTLYLMGSPLARAFAFDLFNIAQNQSPLGTLPHDDALLARLLRISDGEWADLRRLAITPLHGWRLYDCDGVRRWGHPVVLEVLEDAVARRVRKSLSSEEAEHVKRIQRLRDRLGAIGLGEAVLKDTVLIERINDWLMEHWKGRRTIQAHLKVLQVAKTEGWFGDRGMISAF
jgi:hypothetical protein